VLLPICKFGRSGISGGTARLLGGHGEKSEHGPDFVPEALF